MTYNIKGLFLVYADKSSLTLPVSCPPYDDSTLPSASIMALPCQNESLQLQLQGEEEHGKPVLSLWFGNYKPSFHSPLVSSGQEVLPDYKECWETWRITCVFNEQ